MKKFKKLISIMLTVVMALAMSITAFAQDVAYTGEDGAGATITINNAAKGETYNIYKLFDATVSEDGEKIAYQGDIPAVLSTYFTKDVAGNISPTSAILKKDSEGKETTEAEMTSELQTALEEWVDKEGEPYLAMSAVSEGDTLKFTGLPYGYYVMTTSHKSDAPKGEEAKSAITVTSTQPAASIYDKNVNEPSAKKKVEHESYSIGDTIKYTATFDTTNYMDHNGKSEQVVNYVISDTLPEYLSKVEVTSVTIDDNPYTVDDGGQAVVPQFDTEKKITIPWATKEDDGSYTSLYAQGAPIVITYTAVLTSTTNINTANTNTVSIVPTVDRGPEGPKPWEKPWEDSAVIKTYAAAIKKVDGDNNPLAGATFTIKGLEVEDVSAGVYRVKSYNPDPQADESAELKTDGNGKLYIVGLAEDVTLTVTEFKAPDGYNKLTETKELKAQKLSETIYETSGKKYYDEDGNLVKEEVNSTTVKTDEETAVNLEKLDGAALEIKNEQGTLLPSTGGIGTTIFYIIGGILVIGAGIILVVKKRASHE